MFKRSCEDSKTIYFCWFGKRYVFYDGKYVGWYRPRGGYMKVPCKGCEERVLRCHSTCPRYEEFKKENARIQQMKKEDNEVRSLIIENIMKTKNKLSHKWGKLNGNQVD